jgi:hypothetical protein
MRLAMTGYRLQQAKLQENHSVAMKSVFVKKKLRVANKEDGYYPPHRQLKNVLSNGRDHVNLPWRSRDAAEGGHLFHGLQRSSNQTASQTPGIA